MGDLNTKHHNNTCFRNFVDFQTCSKCLGRNPIQTTWARNV